MSAALNVQWADDARAAAHDAPAGVTVIGIRGQGNRDAARLAIRAALTEALARHAGVDPGRIVLHTPQATAPWAEIAQDGAPRRAQLAISHDGELSVAAFSFDGPVGVDISQLMPVPDWEAVARDYLGPDVMRALAAVPAPERDTAFAHAWSEHEARVKCLGLELAEWHDALGRLLQRCRCLPLALPDGYVGSLALPVRQAGAATALP